MTEYLYGKEYLERQHHLVELLSKDPALDKSGLNYMGRVDKFRAALKKDKRLAVLAREHNWDSATIAHAEKLCDLPGAWIRQLLNAVDAQRRVALMTMISPL